jgi:hypothetical protein
VNIKLTLVIQPNFSRQTRLTKSSPKTTCKLKFRSCSSLLLSASLFEKNVATSQIPFQPRRVISHFVKAQKANALDPFLFLSLSLVCSVI